MTRKEYMESARTDSMSAHRKYYGQYVTESLKIGVRHRIGIKRLRASRDEHMNDIPLIKWDELAPYIEATCRWRLRENGDCFSLAGAVCIAKEAARQILEEG